MVATNDYTTFEGNFKQVYANKLLTLYPNFTKLIKEFDFEFAESLGDKFNQPVDLSMEHGVTYAAANTASITLLQPTAGQMKNAQVDGSQIYSRSRINYETMKRATAAKTDAAFVDSTKHLVKRLLDATTKRVEASLLHGRRGWGTIATGGVSGAGTTRTWTISSASWSSALWGGTEGMTLDVWDSAYSAKVNTNLKVTITSVNIDEGTRTISVSGNATDLTNIVAGMHLFPESASPTTEFAGIDSIGQTSGTLFGISNTTYNLFKSPTVAVGGRISMPYIQQAVRRLYERGNTEDTIALISGESFEVLNSDLAALRRQDSSYKTTVGENGVESIMYHSVHGNVKIMPHPFQKNGLGHVVAPAHLRRIGVTDIGFVSRDEASGGSKLLFDLQDSPEKEMRCMFHGALFTGKPAQAICTLTGIDNS